MEIEINSKVDYETKEGIQDMKDGNVKTEQEMESFFNLGILKMKRN